MEGLGLQPVEVEIVGSLPTYSKEYSIRKLESRKPLSAWSVAAFVSCNTPTKLSLRLCNKALVTVAGKLLIRTE